jgi:hypothetical protein
MAWLRDRHPDLIPRYQALYGKGAYAPREYQASITAKVERLARKHGVGRRTPATARRIPPPVPAPEQLSLV